jgi:hypothetical protein
VGAIKRSNHKSCRRRETPPTFMTNKVNETKVKSTKVQHSKATATQMISAS